LGTRITEAPQPAPAPDVSASASGFTLIELIVVIALISILLFFSVPRFQGTIIQDSTQKAVRWVIYTVKSLRQNAVKNRSPHTLHIDMNAGSMWVSDASMSEEDGENARQRAYEFPDHMEILDVEFPDGEKTSYGTVEVRFYPKGYSDRAMIHFESDDDRQITLSIEPFLPNVGVYDTYVGYEN
jgi:prepilin-type N-terminal cleavage/methylation domain-containing protein